MAEINLGTWSPLRLHVLIGVNRITGFGEDDMISLAYDGDKFTKQTGVVDEVARSHVNINGGVFTFSLLQTSQANDVFYDILRTDLANQASGESNSAIFTLRISDLNGTTRLVAEQSWIKNYAEQDFGKEAKVRQWSIDTANIVGHLGGNTGKALSTIAGSVFDNLNN